ncbi:nuclear transport factor 2 family protein [Streptomyces sp. NBC_00083]|uniref:nuclear transport factor 2 family protein n=1 Tax=Streptomyces sp. NBC_00083 TaxID=2975647 RepID=UPI00224FB69D|nr:nuclear transport factor 2 family protein [Streptomyces sp. NBC_00083]MCX5387329.1 nuclear transport factor 2 family protein [Streptomyces sp. NBC_00083]
MTTTKTARELAEAYFTAWETGDFETLRALLARDIDFVGPLGTASGVEEALAGLKGLGRVLEKIDVRARVAEDPDVITWFDLYTSVAPPTPTANWMHTEDGHITRIRVAFDPRELVAGFERSA